MVYNQERYLTCIPTMDIPQILEFVDVAVGDKTGKHLNDLQRIIIAGILMRQKYAEVAENNGYSDKHVKKASHELLRVLSDVFGEPVKKSNLESALERHIHQNITTLSQKKNRHKYIKNPEQNIREQNIIGISGINHCPEISPATPDKSQPATSDDRDSNNPMKIDIIDKLRGFGLSDEQIAEALGLPLEAVKQI